MIKLKLEDIPEFKEGDVAEIILNDEIVGVDVFLEQLEFDIYPKRFVAYLERIAPPTEDDPSYALYFCHYSHYKDTINQMNDINIIMEHIDNIVIYTKK